MQSYISFVRVGALAAVIATGALATGCLGSFAKPAYQARLQLMRSQAYDLDIQAEGRLGASAADGLRVAVDGGDLVVPRLDCRQHCLYVTRGVTLPAPDLLDRAVVAAADRQERERLGRSMVNRVTVDEVVVEGPTPYAAPALPDARRYRVAYQAILDRGVVGKERTSTAHALDVVIGTAGDRLVVFTMRYYKADFQRHEVDDYERRRDYILRSLVVR